MRKTKTGGTRSDDEGKIDYVHCSALVERVHCEYMHGHRTKADGKMREADNWKKGMPWAWYRKSFLGHVQDIKMLMEGNKVFEDGKEVTFFDAVFGLKFNIDGLVHTTMKGYICDRKFTDGKIEREFNERFMRELKKR